MRRILMAGLLATTAALPLCAQGASFGVVGGFVSSNVKFSSGDLTGQSARSGFAAGVGITAGSSAFQFAPEALYVEKGISGNSGGTFGNLRLAYVEVPVLFRLSFAASPGIHPFLTAGPTVAEKVSCKLSVTTGSSTQSTNCDASSDGTDPVNKMDFGAMFGGGVAGGRLSLSVRYEIGLSNLNKDDSGETIKNKALYVLAGISF
jgi:Outer membrane protein beta-barrel domain